MRFTGLFLAGALALSGCAAPSVVLTPTADPTTVVAKPAEKGTVPISAASASAGASPQAAEIWRPAQGLSWQLQYAGALAATEAQVVDLDGVETSKAQVAALHAQGKKVVCYFSAGSWENWRPDRTKFLKSLIGKPLDGWPDERWLDIRQLKKLMPIMAKRLDQCRDKGFDAVDPDNLDGYANAPTGFPLTQKHALAYLKALAKAAHSRGLAIGLKNALALLPKATGLVEFAVNEQCLQYHECGRYSGLVAAGKPVFQVEYSGTIAAICAARPAGFSTVRKHLNLDAWAQYC